jgi:hypothetical protein
MAHDLRLLYGSGSINLDDGVNYEVTSYVPNSPNLSTVDYTGESVADGGERPLTTRRNVTETVGLLISGSSENDLVTAVENLERWISWGERYQGYGTGCPLYIKFRPGSAGSTWRSEVLSGKLELDKAALSYPWRARKIKAWLSWSRRFFWETEDLRAVEITVPVGGPTPGWEMDITNHLDASQDYYNKIPIAASAVDGAIPTPVALTLTSGIAAGSYLRNIYIGHYVGTGASSVVYFTNDEYVSGGASQASTECAFDDYKNYTLSTVTSTELFYLTFDSADLGTYAGRYFQAFAWLAFGANAGQDLWVKMQIRLNADTPIWTSQEVKLNTVRNLQNLGTIQLPPYVSKLYAKLGISGYCDLQLAFFFRKSAVGSWTIGLDYLQFLPTDSFRHLTQTAYVPTAENDMVVDYGEPGEAYYFSNSLGNILSFATEGGPIMLWPQKEQCLFLQWDQWDGKSGQNGKLTARLYYRPRCLTL